MSWLMRIALVVLVAACSAILVVPFSSSASSSAAPARNGICDPGEFCLYFNSDHAGSLSDVSHDIPDYGSNNATCNHFIGPGNGKNRCVKNQAASVWNRTGSYVIVWFNSGYKGPNQLVNPYEKTNLNAQLKNNNASHKLYAAAKYRANGCRINGPQNENELQSGRTCPPGNFPYLPNRVRTDDFDFALDPYTDGCSGPGLNIFWTHALEYDFREACAMHDYAYDLIRWRTPGISKQDADNRLNAAMKADCATQFVTDRLKCYSMAAVIFKAVRDHGDPHKPNDGVVIGPNNEVRYP